MTAKQSRSRLTLYCLAAFLTPIASNWVQMEQASSYQWIGMFLQAAVSMIIAARAYIDQTPNQVVQQ